MQTLLELLGRASTLVNSLKGDGGDAATLVQLRDVFAEMDREMREHLREEEEIGLPMMRHAFSEVELKPVIDQILKASKPRNVAWALRPVQGIDQKRHFLVEHGVPRLVVKFIMVPTFKAYDADIVQPVRALIDGQTQAPPPPPSRCTVM